MDNTKRAVHMTTVHHPYDTRIYHKQCQSLHDAGYDVTLIAPDLEDNPNLNNNAQAHTAGFKLLPLKKHKNRWRRMTSTVWEAYKKAKQLKAHIYHFHDPELLLVGWMLKKKGNVVVYDIHEDYVTSIMQKEYLPKPVRVLTAYVYKIIEKVLSKNMELCLAEKYYKDLYPTGKCILNYPTLNEQLINYERHEEPTSNKLIYTGNVTKDRGATIHARLPIIDHSVEVHFIGKCSAQLAKEMYGIAKDKKEQLHIEGVNHFVPRERIDELYVSENWLAGIALFPPTEHYMKKELTKFFEYMSAGIPIICSNFPVWKKFIETYQCGLAVDPNNNEEIKKAIDYLRSNEVMARKMGNNGKEAVIQYLNWSIEEQKLIKWYEDIWVKQQN